MRIAPIEPEERPRAFFVWLAFDLFVRLLAKSASEQKITMNFTMILKLTRPRERESEREREREREREGERRSAKYEHTLASR